MAKRMQVGDKVLIRTVLFHHIGRIESIDETDIILGEASWLAESERFGETLRTGAVRELEALPDGCGVRQSSIIDWFPWTHELPTESK